LQTSDDEIREPVAASQAISITGFVVVRIAGEDALDPPRNGGSDRERPPIDSPTSVTPVRLSVSMKPMTLCLKYGSSKDASGSIGEWPCPGRSMA
jgi:hypothetical protein